MKTLILTLAMIMGVFAHSVAQKESVQGTVLNAEGTETIIGVNVIVKELRIGTASDENGKFHFTIPQGTYTFVLTSIGYEKLEQKVKISGSKELTFKMKENIVSLRDVTISTKRVERSIAKIDADPMDLPITTMSVNRLLIDQTQSNDINKITQYITGIRPQKAYGVKQRFVMRGFDKAVVMVDGIRDENFSSDPYAQPTTNLASVERIEFLKGAESVLYGHSAVGGVLNIVRKQPSAVFQGNANISYGSWNTRQAQLGMSGAITKGLNYRFDASLSNTDGWRDLPRKISNAYLALDYTIDTKNKLELRTGINNDRYTPDGGMPFVGGSIKDLNGKEIYKRGDLLPGVKYDQRYNSTEDFMTHKNKNIALRYIHKFTDRTKLSYQLSYADDRTEYLSSGEELTNPMVDVADKNHNAMIDYYGETKYVDLTKFNQATIYRHAIRAKSVQNYLELNTKFHTGSVKHNAMVGYTFQWIDRAIYFPAWKAFTGKGAFATVSIKDPQLNQGAISSDYWGAQVRQEQTHALYLQDLVEITPQLKAMVGFRADYFGYKYKMEQTKDGGFTLNDTTAYKKFDNMPLSLRAGIMYNPDENVGLYASYATFFKPNRRTYNPDYLYFDKEGKQFFPTDGKEVFKPESGYQIEAGIKYLISNILQLNLSAYTIEKQNVVLYAGKSKEGKYQYTQAGRVSSKGFEFDATINPLKGLSIITGYGFVKAKYEKNNTDKFGEYAYAGKLIPNLPQHQAHAWINYTVPKGVLQNLRLSLGGRYSSKTISSIYADSNLDMSSYTLVDAGLGYSFKKVYINLNVNNLFNEEYFPYSTGSSQLLPGEERNYLLTLGVKF